MLPFGYEMDVRRVCILKYIIVKLSDTLNVKFKWINQAHYILTSLFKSEIALEPLFVEALNPLSDESGETRVSCQTDRRVRMRQTEIKRVGGEPCLYMHGWWKNVSLNGSQLSAALRTAKGIKYDITLWLHCNYQLCFRFHTWAISFCTDAQTHASQMLACMFALLFFS